MTTNEYSIFCGVENVWNYVVEMIVQLCHIRKTTELCTLKGWIYSI